MPLREVQWKSLAPVATDELDLACNELAWDPSENFGGLKSPSPRLTAPKSWESKYEIGEVQLLDNRPLSPGCPLSTYFPAFLGAQEGYWDEGTRWWYWLSDGLGSDILSTCEQQDPTEVQ